MTSDVHADGRHGNTLLKELFARHPERYRDLRFSILRTLARSMTPKEVIGVESACKQKLGTRAFGLNDN